LKHQLRFERIERSLSVLESLIGIALRWTFLQPVAERNAVVKTKHSPRQRLSASGTLPDIQNSALEVIDLRKTRASR